jgi:hypothetical protein
MPPEASARADWIEKARRDLTMAEFARVQGADFADQV